LFVLSSHAIKTIKEQQKLTIFIDEDGSYSAQKDIFKSEGKASINDDTITFISKFNKKTVCKKDLNNDNYNCVGGEVDFAMGNMYRIEKKEQNESESTDTTDTLTVANSGPMPTISMNPILTVESKSEPAVKAQYEAEGEFKNLFQPALNSAITWTSTQDPQDTIAIDTKGEYIAKHGAFTGKGVVRFYSNYADFIPHKDTNAKQAKCVFRASDKLVNCTSYGPFNGIDSVDYNVL